MTTPVPCPLCGRQSALWFSAAERDVYRCASCGHVHVPQGLARLADGRSIYEHEDAVFTADGNAEYYFDETNLLAARAKLAYVTRFVHGGTLVDAGASYGQFLSVAREVFDGHGFEVSPEAVAFSRRTFGVANVIGSVYEWPAAFPETVDVITCWDVIEHLDDPARALSTMRDRLRPGGWLFLSTPDAGAPVARLMGRRWHYLDPVQHISVFSRKNLTALLEQQGLRVRDRCTFGRKYRVSYVLNRLMYLHPHPAFRTLAGAIRGLTRPLHRIQVPIALGDVMGLAAQRRD